MKKLIIGFILLLFTIHGFSATFDTNNMGEIVDLQHSTATLEASDLAIGISTGNEVTNRITDTAEIRESTKNFVLKASPSFTGDTDFGGNISTNISTGYFDDVRVDEKIGIGISDISRSTTARLYCYSGGSGQATPHTLGRIVIEDDLHAALCFLTTDTDDNYIMFGDSEDSYIGGIQYKHISNKLNLFSGNTYIVEIDTTSGMVVTGDVTATDFYGNGEHLTGIVSGDVANSTFNFIISGGGDVATSTNGLVAIPGKSLSVPLISTWTITGYQAYNIYTSSVASTYYRLAYSTCTDATSLFSYIIDPVEVPLDNKYSVWIDTYIVLYPQNTVALHITDIPATGTLSGEYGMTFKAWRKND